jgi:hypothetical protein
MSRDVTRIDDRTVDAVPLLERHPVRRRLLRSVLAVVVGAVFVVGLSLFPAWRAARHLQAGRGELAMAVDRIATGETAEAVRAFAGARERFAAALDDANSPLMRAVGAIPLLGGNFDALGGLAKVGRHASAAGESIASALATLPDGLASLAPARGRIPLETMGSLLPAVRQARAELEVARDAAASLPRSFLIDPVWRATEAARREGERALAGLRSSEALLEVLPSFAGRDAIRRYFVAAQTPAELRGTGGFIGSFAIMTANQGRLRLGRFQEISVLKNVPASEAPAASDAFRQIYDRFGGAGSWRNLNMTPDAPTAGRLIEALYERIEGIRLDGTIFVTPRALSEMLEATGPVRAPLLDRTLTAGGVVDYLAYEAYEDFGYRSALRKRLLGLVAGAMFRQFLRDADPEAALRSLADATSGGHLTLHAADPDVQAAFRTAGVAGELGAPGSDFFGVFTSDASGTKVNYFARRHVRYEIALGAEGSASVHAFLTFRNDASRDAERSYPLGPYPETGLGVGEELSFLSVYCAPGCEMTAASEAGEATGMEVHRERGLRSLHRYVRVPPQGSRYLALSLHVRDAWRGDDAQGVYRLRLQAQPTVRPTEATVVVRVPDGMRVVATDPSMAAEAQEAVWSGVVEGAVDLEVRFRKPIARRLWDALSN